MLTENQVTLEVVNDGEDGTSAYEAAVEGGYEGTEQEFNEDLCDISDSVNHFWTNTDGAHITEVDRETFESNPTGGNTLIDSEGVYIRDGVNSIAQFTADGAQIGQDDTARTNITSQGFSVFTNENVNAIGVDSSGGTDIEYVELSNDTPMDVSVNHGSETIANFDEIIADVEVGRDVKVSVVAEVIEYYYETTVSGFKRQVKRVVQTTSFTFDITKGTSISKAISGIKGTTEITSNTNTTLVSTFNYDGTTDTLTYSSSRAMARFRGYSDTHKFYTKVHLVISGQFEVSIPSTKMNGEVSWLTPEKVFKINPMAWSGNVTASSGAEANATVKVTMEGGYYPVMVAGFSRRNSSSGSGVSNWCCGKCSITSRSVGSATVQISGNAAGGGVTKINLGVELLWVKCE